MKKYKAYIKNNYFYLEDTQTGEIWVSFKKEVQIDPSNARTNNYRIFNLEDWDSKISVSLLQLLKEDGSPFSAGEWEDFYTESTGNYGDGAAAPPIDYTPFFEELIELAKNDESYQLFEDTDGNVLFGKLDEDGVMTYIKPDGSVYTGDVKPYSRETKQTITDYCAGDVPYSLIQLRDADTKEVIVSIWRNDIDLTESNTAPANKVKGACVVPPIDYTTILTSIDSKLNLLNDIKDKLTEANTTLTNIENETTEININLTTLIQKATDQITELQGIKGELVAGNLKLDQIVLKLTNIDSNISTIKIDIASIKTSVESIDTKLDDVVTSLSNLETLIGTSNNLLQSLIDELNISIEIESYEKNNGTINYLQKDTILWNNETGIEISKTTEYSINGTDWTSTPPAGDVNLGFIATTIAPEVICVENVTYELVGNKSLTFEPLMLNSYSVFIDEGMAKLKEVNETSYKEAGRMFSSGFDNDQIFLPNEVKITNKDADSVTVINVLKRCDKEPVEEIIYYDNFDVTADWAGSNIIDEVSFKIYLEGFPNQLTNIVINKFELNGNNLKANIEAEFISGEFDISNINDITDVKIINPTLTNFTRIYIENQPNLTNFNNVLINDSVEIIAMTLNALNSFKPTISNNSKLKNVNLSANNFTIADYQAMATWANNLPIFTNTCIFDFTGNPDSPLLTTFGNILITKNVNLQYN